MNPYKRWLGITSGTTNPDYFELLGIDHEEFDKDVIKAAAKFQLAKLQKHRSGRYADACEKITKRINRAYSVLTNSEKRKTYVIRLAEQNGQPTPDVADINKRRFSQNKQTDGLASKAKSAALSEWENQKNNRITTSSYYKKIAIFTAIALPLLVSVGLAFYFIQPKEKGVASLDSQPDKLVNATDKTDAALTNTDEIEGERNIGDESVESESNNHDDVKSVAPHDPTLAPDFATMAKPVSDFKADLAAGSNNPTKDLIHPQVGPVASEKPAGPGTEPTHASNSESGLGNNDLDDTAELVKVVSDDGFADNGLPARAHAILIKYCTSCHGGGDAEEGGFDFVLNRSAMVAAGYITPGKPGISLLFERLTSSEAPMPPAGEPTPTDKETKTIRDWIRGGATDFVEKTDGEYVSTTQIYKTVSDDLKKVKSADRKFTRYFSVQHLANAGYSESEIETTRLALQKLLNSLSWHRKLAELKAVAGSKTIFRVDLRSFKWRPSEWELVESKYEYAVLHDSTAALDVLTETESEVPVIRGDWFVAQASRPPLYHDLLQLPDSDSKLEQMLQVDIESNLDEFDTVRAGFTRSGVSQNNRLIERHDSLFGPYWKSYDFGGNTGRKNLFEFPLGPGETSIDFEHDGGEIIFTLPNGMLAFMLVDQSGNRIDKGPTAIVSDPRQPDRAVVNGVSCMSCHYGGYIPKDDEIRGHVLANKSAYTRAEDILALYPEPDSFRKILLADSQTYLDVLKSIGIGNPSRAKEPVVMVANRFGKEVSAKMAAAELGIKDEQLREKIKGLRDLDLVRQVGPLGVAGGMLKRETFSGIYLKLVVEMGLGRRAFVAPPQIAKTEAATPKTTHRQPLFGDSPNSSLPYGSDAQAAETALNNAVRLTNQRQLDQAVVQFEDAIRLATNLQFRARAYEEAMEVFAAKGKIQAIINGYVDITSDLQGTETINKARDQFFRTLIKFLVSSKSVQDPNHGWRSWEQRRTNWQLSSHKVPLSVANMIGKAFENKLKNDPGHEPSLRILETHYGVVSRNEKRLYEILLQIRKLVNDRGETLDYNALRSLASLYIKNGEPAKSAMIHNKWNNQKWSSNDTFRSGYLDEAYAWIAANEKQKALKVLQKAEDDILKKNVKVHGYNFERMQRIFESIDEGQRMIPLVKKAIKNGGSKYDIERLQKILRSVLASSEGGAENLVSAETKELLDPSQGHRAQARYWENQSKSSPSSMANYLTKAAESWHKAGEKNKAIKVLQSAENALKKADRNDNSVSGYYRSIGNVYLKLEENQRALDTFLVALERSSNRWDVTSIHKTVVDLIKSDSSLKVPKKLQELTDPKFAIRQEAAILEKKSKPGDYGYVRNLIDATEKWLEAGEIENVKRCGAVAAKAIDQLEPQGHIRSKTKWITHVSHHEKLAKIYKKAQLYPKAISQYEKGINRTSSDYQLEDFIKEIKNICDQHDIEMPKFPEEIMVLLDPLNKYRVQAREYEEKASEEPLNLFYIEQAVKKWQQAKEIDDVRRTTDQWGRRLRKLGESDLSFSYKCEDVAETYEEIGEYQKAIQFLEFGRDAEEHDFMKEKYDEKIARLKKRLDKK